MTTRRLLLSAWEPGFVTPLLCGAALAVYFMALRGRISGRAGFFVAAVGLFFVALVSPIGVLARGYLFSAHMLQHLILLLAVPPLALLALPDEPAGPSAHTIDDRLRERKLLQYVVPWCAGVGAMWIWHAPSLCNAAAASPQAQWVQVATLVLMGLFFWRPILTPRIKSRFAPFAAVIYLFVACGACSILGILVTFSPISVCDAYAQPMDQLGVLPLLRGGWGLSTLADQQLGGLLMWVPACLVYGVAMLATLARYYREEERSPLSRVAVSGHR